MLEIGVHSATDITGFGLAGHAFEMAEGSQVTLVLDLSRLPLLPGSRELIELAYVRGAAGACLSGAGPSVLAICDSPISAHGVEKAWNAAGVAGMATRLRFDTSGARLTTPDAPTADAELP